MQTHINEVYPAALANLIWEYTGPYLHTFENAKIYRYYIPDDCWIEVNPNLNTQGKKVTGRLMYNSSIVIGKNIICYDLKSKKHLNLPVAPITYEEITLFSKFLIAGDGVYILNDEWELCYNLRSSSNLTMIEDELCWSHGTFIYQMNTDLFIRCLTAPHPKAHIRLFESDNNLMLFSSKGCTHHVYRLDNLKWEFVDQFSLTGTILCVMGCQGYIFIKDEYHWYAYELNTDNFRMIDLSPNVDCTWSVF